MGDANQQQTVWKTYVRNLWWHVNPALLRAEATKAVDPHNVCHVKIHRTGIMDRPDKMCSAFITMSGQQAATELSIAWNGANIPCLSKFELESSAIGEMMPAPKRAQRPDPVLVQQQHQGQQPPTQVPTTSRRTPVVVPPRFPKTNADTEKSEPVSSTTPRSHPTNADPKEKAPPVEQKPEGKKEERQEEATAEKTEGEAKNRLQEPLQEQKPEGEKEREEEATAEKTEEGEEKNRLQEPLREQKPEGAHVEREEEATAEKTEEGEEKNREEQEEPAKEEKPEEVTKKPKEEESREELEDIPEDNRTVFSHSSSNHEKNHQGSDSSETTLDMALLRGEEDAEKSDTETVPASFVECKQEIDDQENTVEPLAELIPTRQKEEPERSSSCSEERKHRKKKEKKRKKKRKDDKKRRDTTTAASEDEFGHRRRDYYDSRERQPWERRQALRRDRARHYDERKARWIHYVLSYKKNEGSKQ